MEYANMEYVLLIPLHFTVPVIANAIPMKYVFMVDARELTVPSITNAMDAHVTLDNAITLHDFKDLFFIINLTLINNLFIMIFNNNK